MKKSLLITSAIIFIIILLLETSPFFKFNIFKVMNPEWVQITSFKIVKTDVVCSRIGRGLENLAQLNVTYQYYYDNKMQIKTQNNTVTVYKLYIFEKCEDLKNRTLLVWNQYYKNNHIELWVNKQNYNQSKILISDKSINIRISKISFYISEAQGLIGGFILMIAVIFIYLFLKKN